MIVSSTARVDTTCPARFGKLLTQRLAKKMVTEWNEDLARGSIRSGDRTVGLAQLEVRAEDVPTCTLVAGDAVLLLHIEAEQHDIERFEHIIASHAIQCEQGESFVVSFRRSDGNKGVTYRWED